MGSDGDSGRSGPGLAERLCLGTCGRSAWLAGPGAPSLRPLHKYQLFSLNPESEAAGVWAADFVSKLLHNNSVHMSIAISIYQRVIRILQRV